MFVLMDMEWIENKTHYFCPTQISAMRVDTRWNCVDCFDALIKPFDSSCRQWNHMAYSGAEPEAFLSADAGPLVLINLFRWLRTDDVLCWWGEQPALVFQNVVGNLLHRNVNHDMRLIYPGWKMDTSDGHLKVGSPYKLARDRGIKVPDVEHSSANDVEAMRALLFGTFTSSAVIRGSLISPKARIKKQAEFQKEHANKRNPAAEPLHHRLLYDEKNKLLHVADCPDIVNKTEMQGFDAYKSCIQKGLAPCRCCREEYWQENWRLSQDIIQKCKFNYINQREGKSFHRTSCIHARRIPFVELRGGVYYENCLKNGLKPCGWCKPTKAQQTDPSHIYQKKQRKTSHGQADDVWLMTRRLTQDEKTALNRHAVAKKERAALAKDTRTKSQGELRDEHILTQTGYAFWAAAGYQTFHLRNCSKLEHISGLRGYARYSDAVHAGLTPCKLCKPTSKFDIKASVPIYQEERKGETIDILDRLCDSQGYPHRYDAPDYFIETPVGKWRLDTRTLPVDVFHINLVTSPDTTLYHKQHRLFLSLSDTFEYIRRHERSLMAKVKADERNIDDPREDSPAAKSKT